MSGSWIESDEISGHEERNVIAINPTVNRAHTTLEAVGQRGNSQIAWFTFSSRFRTHESSTSLDSAYLLFPERLGKPIWLINDSTELPDLIEKIKAALPRGVAEIEKYVKDEDLRDYFLADPHNCGGYVNQHRLRCLAVLVTDYGPSEKLPGIFAELRALLTYKIYQDVQKEIELNIKRLEQIAEAKALQRDSAV